ncbi:unnamed protein product [Paramecium pentaurelia]|uniref:Uncharacterized protein n=1 Tax=Paramecium pentaurelia TaxID=43138 RepID=A0A8S1V1M8_9CILI|nr:unnamed protein product [Paramecium pentaurelia]
MLNKAKVRIQILLNNKQNQKITFEKNKETIKQGQKVPIGHWYDGIRINLKICIKMKPKIAFSSKQNWKCKKVLDNNDRFFINPPILLLLLERQMLIQNIVILKCSSLMKQDATMKMLQINKQFFNLKLMLNQSINQRIGIKRSHIKSQDVLGGYQLEVTAHRQKGVQPLFLISKGRFEEQFSEKPCSRIIQFKQYQ